MGRTILPDPTPAPVVAPSAPMTTAATPEAGAAPPAPVEGAGTVAAGAEGATGAAPPPVAEETPEQVAKGVRAKAAADAAMAAAKRARENVARQQTQDREREQLRQENARLTAEQATWREFQQLSQTDKIAAARRLGLTPGEITKAAIAEGTPEHSAKALREEIAREFEDKYGKQLTEQQKLIDGWTNAQRAAAQRSAESAVTTAAADATKYPHLADMPPVMVLELARSVIAGTPQEQRALITNEDLLQFLEAQHVAHRKARSTTSPGTQTVATPISAAGSPQPRTQMNGAKGAVALPVPEGWDTWSDGKQKRWMADNLKPAIAAPARQAVSK